MLYGLIENNKVVKSLSYINEEAHPGLSKGMTLEELEQFNIFPIDLSLPGGYDDKVHNIVNHALSELTFDKELKVIKGFRTYELKSLDDVYQKKIAEINNARTLKLFSNLPHPLLNGGSVQIRNAQDLTNLSMLMNDAIATKLYGIEKSHVFIDSKNTVHTLTADQMIELCTAVKEHVELIHTMSWTAKFDILESIYNSPNLSLTDKIHQISYYNWVVE